MQLTHKQKKKALRFKRKIKRIRDQKDILMEETFEKLNKLTKQIFSPNA